MRSAVIYASQDVSVVAINTTSSKSYAYNGAAEGGSGNPGFGVVGTDVHLPLIMYGSWRSRLAIQNTGAAQANVTLHFENSSSRSYTISPNGVLFLDNLWFLGTGYVGSVRIVSDQSVAAVASHTKDVGATHVAFAHNAFAAGSSSNQFPLVMRRYNPPTDTGWNTGIQARNLGSSSTNATLTYRPINQSGTYNYTAAVPANGSTTFYLPHLPGFPDNTYGVATLQASQSLASVVNATKYTADVAVSANGFLSTDGTDTIILPVMYKGYSGRDSGVQAQNVGSQATDVEVRYYDSSGNEECTIGSVQMNSQEGHNFYSSICPPSGFAGSAVVSASGGGARIVAQVITTNYGASYAFGYNGVNR